MTLAKKAAALGTLLIALLSSGCTQTAEPDTEELPKLSIGTDTYAPYSYTDENGEFAGIDIALAEEACRRIGYTPVFSHIVWDEKDALLENGSLDCLWSCFSMNDREDLYTWAGPYMNSRHVVAVYEDSEISSLAELEGCRVGVQSSTKPETLFLKKLNGLPEISGLFCFTQNSNVVAALRNDYVDAIAGPEAVLADYFSQTTGEFRILDEALQESKLGVAFPKDCDSGVPEKLDKALREMKLDGTSARIVESYGIDPDKVLGGVLDE